MQLRSPATGLGGRCNVQGDKPLDRARERMVRTGQWRTTQLLGRRWAIGCVALEITQRCNLDCTLCYLSENSEAVHDLPLEEIFRRIDVIAEHYGPNTGVQVTGGEPTLRNRADLVQIVRCIREKGLRPSLFTNGIKASRSLLTELATAGLADVAFHVDTTQQRKGYDSEEALNAVRREYIARVRGLPLTVFFNTTIHDQNFDEIEAVARFFVRHSDTVRIASFQLQADAGRGVQRARGEAIDIASVTARLSAGAAARLNFAAAVGHPACNRFAAMLVANGRAYNLFDSDDVFSILLSATAGLPFDTTSKRRMLCALLRGAAKDPAAIARVLGWGLRKAGQMVGGLLASRGRAYRLTFHVHNFMDAERLQAERIEACAFMVATAEGPVSMCLHNAQRDDFILKPIKLASPAGDTTWNPRTGALAGSLGVRRHTVLKGRSRVGEKPLESAGAATPIRAR